MMVEKAARKKKVNQQSTFAECLPIHPVRPEGLFLRPGWLTYL
jgi:hypothetical protein